MFPFHLLWNTSAAAATWGRLKLCAHFYASCFLLQHLTPDFSAGLWLAVIMIFSAKLVCDGNFNLRGLQSESSSSVTEKSDFPDTIPLETIGGLALKTWALCLNGDLWPTRLSCSFTHVPGMLFFFTMWWGPKSIPGSLASGGFQVMVAVPSHNWMFVA